MDLIKKIKEQKSKERSITVNPQMVEVVINNYEDIQIALNQNYNYKDIELALFDELFNEKTNITIADICYIIGKVLEKYNLTTAQAESKTATQPKKVKETKTKTDGNIIYKPIKPSSRSLSEYMKDKNISGYAVEFTTDYNTKYRYALWLIAPNEERAKNTAGVYLHDGDKRKGQKHSYRFVNVYPITYDDYILKYGHWYDAD